MDITRLVKAKRQCSFYEWTGYIIGSISIVFALFSPWLFLIIAALFIASYSTKRGSRIGAAIHTVLVGILLALFVFNKPGYPA